MSAPFTPEQEARIREIVREELAAPRQIGLDMDRLGRIVGTTTGFPTVSEIDHAGCVAALQTAALKDPADAR